MNHDCSKNTAATEQDRFFLNDNDEAISAVADLFKLLGDRTRIKILFTLTSGAKNVCTIASLINSTHSATSHQMRILKDNRLVKFNKVGKEVFYSLDDHHVAELLQTTLQHTSHIDC